MPNKELSVALPEKLNSELTNYMIRKDGEEDLIFALWTPSQGIRRFSALVHTLIYPIENDRQRHGNASFNPQYFERVCSIAAKEACGIAFLHSHPAQGWQEMSIDDIVAEKKIAGAVAAITELPLVGMTVGSDKTWSARTWEHINGRRYERNWCHSVRSTGERLRVNFTDSLIPEPAFHELFRRTVTVWGKANHINIARLRIGIVGLGSVGSIVAETLARMGLERFALIDFDEIQPHNLDRQLGATIADIGRLKIDVAERQVRQSATAVKTEIITTPYSIAEKEGYRTALDCDVLFSCVDRPRARSILNHFAYAHLIPVIDGGIEVRFKNGSFSGTDWQLQTVAPGRPCLECIGAFNPSDVDTEKAGMLDDSSYLKGLPPNHRFKRNENVFPFSTNLASLEVMQFIALVTGIGGINNFGIQRYRYNPGIIEADVEKSCKAGCETSKLIGYGDRYFNLYGRDLSAEAARKRQNLARNQ